MTNKGIAKAFSDAYFVAAYTTATVGSAAQAVIAFSNSGISGTLAVATAPSGAGGVAFGAVATEELARGTILTGVSFVSSKLMERSHSIFAESGGKLKDMVNRVENLVSDYTAKVLDKFKLSRDYSGTSYADSTILGKELKAAGIDKPQNYKSAAHHIVPSKDSRANRAREILDEFGIDYNSASNGVFLPYERNSYVASEALHVGKHSKSYITGVTKMLEAAKNSGLGRDGVVNVLNSIRTKLLRGQLKLN